MNLLSWTIENDSMLQVGWTLVHFLWQGALLAALFALLHTALRKQDPNIRYLAGCFTLALMLVVPLLTFLWLGRAPQTESDQSREWLNPITSSTASINADLDSKSSPVPSSPEPPPTPGLFLAAPIVQGFAAFWLLGVMVLSIRLMLGVAQIARMRNFRRRALSDHLAEPMKRLGLRMGIRRPVGLFESAFVNVPTVVGWFRPLILLPASCLTGLTSAQLESILAHELAHVKRGDYLINFLQNLAETFLFFHPGVWWVSGWIRAEREYCCDDLAVQVCGDRLTYSRALVTLEELKTAPSLLGMAANGVSLLDRIGRLSGIPGSSTDGNTPRRGGFLMFILMGSMASLVVLSGLVEADPGKTTQENNRPSITAEEVVAVENESFFQIRLVRESSTEKTEKIVFQPQGSPEAELYLEKEPLLDLSHVARTLVTGDAASLESRKLVLELNPGGQKFLNRFTGNHVGERLAVWINGEIVSAPRIDQRIQVAMITLEVRDPVALCKGINKFLEKRVREESLLYANPDYWPKSIDLSSSSLGTRSSDGFVSQDLFTRVFKIDTEELLARTGSTKADSSGIQSRVREVVEEMLQEENLQLDGTKHKMFFNDRTGVLWLRAPPRVLDKIQEFLERSSALRQR